MGRLLTITRSEVTEFGIRKSAYMPQVKVGKRSLGFITIVLFLVLSLFYLTQANQIATKGYQIRELELKKAQALEKQESLKIEAARLRSIKEIQNSASSSQMVPASEINYIFPDKSVAKK
ncbi:hypothetical protein COX95_04120 [bacterium CG_4_10_14_0_2_um_filter_33_32]|nr:MAG: hypothetical protein AUJ93_01485 [bacterium CG2_30_33_46]PIR67491.1 MAG: hypothetical protein COU50_03045 [bacterium CG10_big_fil_rev_8_21_14_0_10_33_18]PIU77009.1 MAG: hypothetical protein COS74_01105 [bacterium CG06_land_8_20_14_3_00_33_50]PIW81753.1 MAG: hypothetical protein COZ97_00080 [bacterium CG_4_8_14_3_um_filter_33_28]PIY85833.1 MAG: hypothetical protein COY76_00055 [bacterium CG_4_10_14_0_8_um_filter_33_57]PIZ85456.1 MAG: hypothetical protein COX95_04120 [bacterium CG_4_10_1